MLSPWCNISYFEFDSHGGPEFKPTSSCCYASTGWRRGPEKMRGFASAKLASAYRNNMAKSARRSIGKGENKLFTMFDFQNF
jgi:hypothetical protein